MEMDQEDKEYFETMALKDQALRTIQAMIPADKGTAKMKASMIKNGMTENGALLSIMETMENNVKR